MTEYVSWDGASNPTEVSLWIGRAGTATKHETANLPPHSRVATVASWHITLDGETPDTKREYGFCVMRLSSIPGARLLQSSASHKLQVFPLVTKEGSIVEDPTTWGALDPVAQTQVLGMTDEQAEMLGAVVANGFAEGLIEPPQPGEFTQMGPAIQGLLERQ